MILWWVGIKIWSRSLLGGIFPGGRGGMITFLASGGGTPTISAVDKTLFSPKPCIHLGKAPL